jgi:hypothetical protein
MVYVCQHILFRARRFSVATFDFPNFLFFFQTGKWFGKESGILIGKKKLKIAEKNQSIENAPDPGGLIDEQGHLQPRQNRQACTRSILYCHQRYLLKGREVLKVLSPSQSAGFKLGLDRNHHGQNPNSPSLFFLLQFCTVIKDI